MEHEGIVSIAVENIYQHPNNPRKDLGDLSELSESIKKKGVMQNLTVIPGHWDEKQEWHDDGYTLIIGHRRCAAAKLAGLEELPCRIVDSMDNKEQISTMLEENMQRNDLTIWEQANGFQMMLDLGETEESIAEKTGFSKTTVRHRLNIAKLNSKELQKKECDEGFQLSLKDLYELEKVKDLRTRNKILKESSSSANLASRARTAATEEKMAENEKVIGKMLEKLGVQKAPETAVNEMYSGKWETVKDFALESALPKSIKLPKEKCQMYYLRYFRTIHVITKAKKENKKLSPYEEKEREKNTAKKKIKAILKESGIRRKKFIADIIAGKTKAVKDEAGQKEFLWQSLVLVDSYISTSSLRRFFLDKDYYKCTEEELQEAREKAESLSTLHQMLVALHESMSNITETFYYDMSFRKEKANALLKGYEALEPYGWYFDSDDEKKVLDGTHELYQNKK